MNEIRDLIIGIDFGEKTIPRSAIMTGKAGGTTALCP